MKRLFIILLSVMQIFLVGCEINILKNEESGKNDTENIDGLDNDEDDEENANEYLLSIEKHEILSSSDILSTGYAFALDVLTEDFERLEGLYSYSEDMEQVITFMDTRKEITFHNLDKGDVEKINEPYIYIYGNNRYVMVPVEAYLYDFNILISFNQNNEIIGFSYEDYKQKSEDKTRGIPDGVLEEETQFISDDLLIHGTLTTPDDRRDDDFTGTYPLVILVHGFGPSDRDSSIFENKPFQDIAWDLALAGIASFRYDKRTYTYEDVANDKSFTVDEETINDVVSAVDMVKELENVNQNKIYILGASQGGYLIPRISGRVTEIEGYILVSSPGQHAKNYIVEQYEYLSMEGGNIGIGEHNTINKIREEVDLLTNPNEIPQSKRVLGYYKDYWLDLNDYNPIEEADEITSSVLVLQGERDYQTTIRQYNLWKDAFFEKENWTFKSYPNLNHFMMKGEGSSYSSEYREGNHVEGQVTQDIANLIFLND